MTGKMTLVKALVEAGATYYSACLPSIEAGYADKIEQKQS